MRPAALCYQSYKYIAHQLIAGSRLYFKTVTAVALSRKPKICQHPEKYENSAGVEYNYYFEYLRFLYFQNLLTYLIFVIFGTPSQFLGLYKVRQKSA